MCGTATRASDRTRIKCVPKMVAVLEGHHEREACSSGRDTRSQHESDAWVRVEFEAVRAVCAPFEASLTTSRYARRPAHWGIEPQRLFHRKRRSTSCGPSQESPRLLSRSTRQTAMHFCPRQAVENALSDHRKQYIIESIVAPSSPSCQESPANSTYKARSPHRSIECLCEGIKRYLGACQW